VCCVCCVCGVCVSGFYSCRYVCVCMCAGMRMGVCVHVCVCVNMWLRMHIYLWFAHFFLKVCMRFRFHFTFSFPSVFSTYIWISSCTLVLDIFDLQWKQQKYIKKIETDLIIYISFLFLHIFFSTVLLSYFIEFINFGQASFSPIFFFFFCCCCCCVFYVMWYVCIFNYFSGLWWGIYFWLLFFFTGHRKQIKKQFIFSDSLSLAIYDTCSLLCGLL
jgi:hypothetical protein